jgi:hypothetical protein
MDLSLHIAPAVPGEGIYHSHYIEWSACTPDCNPIEYLSDLLQAVVARRVQHPRSLREQEKALVAKWNAASRIQKLHDQEHEAAMSFCDYRCYGLSQELAFEKNVSFR